MRNPDRLSADFTLKHSDDSLTVMNKGTAQLGNTEISDFEAWVVELVEIREAVRALWPKVQARRPGRRR